MAKPNKSYAQNKAKASLEGFLQIVDNRKREISLTTFKSFKIQNY